MNGGRNLHDWGRCDPHTCLICKGEWVDPQPEDDQ